jgi:uncharacterized protein YjbJ (UPF0337 family)
MSEHKAEELQGKLKEAIADVTGDTTLKHEGQIDQASAAVKRQIDKGADSLKDALKPKPKAD